MAATEFLADEKASFTTENLIRDNLTLKRRIKALTQTNATKDVKIKTMQKQINNVMSYLSNHKSELEEAVAKHEQAKLEAEKTEAASGGKEAEANGVSSKEAESSTANATEEK